eukprot:TRINITY_DN29451_c0_g1_i2.p2 TRINITY_DN29451_c0_g1~~TRINITY_DN29451_c0_g1_i2.p2  ORF type:complete len:174 (+),score=20.50 TRINITY_DN29451_c0_g1_i2:69-590(+)
MEHALLELGLLRAVQQPCSDLVGWQGHRGLDCAEHERLGLCFDGHGLANVTQAARHACCACGRGAGLREACLPQTPDAVIQAARVHVAVQPFLARAEQLAGVRQSPTSACYDVERFQALGMHAALLLLEEFLRTFYAAFRRLLLLGTRPVLAGLRRSPTCAGCLSGCAAPGLW